MLMRKHIALLILVASAFLMLTAATHAAVPSQLTVQGVLRDQQGQLQSMSIMVGVDLFNSQSGAVALLAAPAGPYAVTATNGLFSFPMPLAAGDLAAVGAASEVWMEVTVDGQMFPRQRLTAEPFALFCKQAESVAQTCSGCITNNMVSTLEGSKITGSVASAAGLLGVPVATTTPGPNQVLRYESGQWVPTDVVSSVLAGSGLSGGDITNSGTISLATTIAGQRDFSDGIVIGPSPSPSPSAAPLFLVTDAGGFGPSFMGPDQVAIGHAHYANGWDASGLCSGGSTAGGNVCMAANTSNWYWGVQRNANTMNTVYELGPQGQHWFFDGNGNYHGQLNTNGGLNLLADQTNATLVLGGANGVGFYGAFGNGSAPQMTLKASGELHLGNSVQAGTISASASTTISGSGTSFDASWVNKYLVSASSDNAGKILSVANSTSLTVDTAMTVNGESFYLATPFQASDVAKNELQMGDVTGNTGRGPGLCAGGNASTNQVSCMFNDGARWAWTRASDGTAQMWIDNTTGNFAIQGGTAFKPGGGSWTTFSDARLKDIAGKFERGLHEILALEPIRYHYKADNPMGAPPGDEHIGFIAQSVQKVIPEAVIERPDGYLMLNNDPIMWTLVNALKEEHRRNDMLQARVERLERNMSAMIWLP
jgi:hypothetical protein